MHNRNLIILVGPTAAGKTALGIEIARYFGTEVISADSRQMYKEMHIGTASPTEEELAAVKHHFVKNKSVTQYYNASMFEIEVLDLVTMLFEKFTTVLMVGGSTLYIDAVCNGIDDLPTVDLKLRDDLTRKYKEEGIEFLREQLKILDPVHYQKVDLSNPNRMMKAIEVSLMTGQPYSSFLTAVQKSREFNIIKVGVNRDRGELFARINSRVDQMISDGLVDEVRSLTAYRDTNALRTVGYREIFEFLGGKTSLENAIEQIKTNTRRYAKRQITWFSRDKTMSWFHPDQWEDIMNYIKLRMGN